ncbi:WRKY transcription factor 34 [Hirschfeldia incana]|nr:WRKY transcription factor 34 [Hirschfeldia incana]
MGEWRDCSPNQKKRSKAELDRDVFLEEDVKDKDFMETRFQEKPCYSRGGLSERIAARSGFNVPTSINTETSRLRSLCLNITSPGVSPSSLLESPVFLPNALLSPTTGKLSSLPSDHKAKDEFFDDIATSISRRSFDPTTIGLEQDDSQAYEQTHDRGLGDSMASSGAPADDGYNWRKYGQKLVKGSEYPRSYYKCTHPNCEVKKKVERSREGHITEIIYAKTHNHPKPSPNRRSGIGSSGACNDMQVDGTEQEGFAGTDENVEWISPVSHSGSMQVQSGARFGYGDTAFFKEEEDRTSHMNSSMGYDGEAGESEPKRRKLEVCGTRGTREPKVVVQTTSDVDILEDGYRWRKYGQKVVKGNPNPRSYYKCTASGCIVTKHVERASDDLTSVLTTYIGKHTHEVPAARNSSHLSPGCSGTIQGGLATQTQNHHVHYPVPNSISEGMVTTNSSTFDFQTPMRPPWADFSVYGGKTELLGLSISGLAIGQERFTGLPTPAISDTAELMLQLAAEPKVEPVSQQELGFSRSSLIYRDMSSLPQI